MMPLVLAETSVVFGEGVLCHENPTISMSSMDGTGGQKGQK
jgi:hypothetical protein